MNNTQQRINDRSLRNALDLIKAHITEAETAQNRDLSAAVGLIVDAGRSYGLLDPAQIMYACDNCAHDIETDVISDDEGILALSGRSGSFYANCALCGAAATHELMHREVV